MANRLTVETKVTRRIKRSKASVFMRRDFEDLGGYGQVGRVLRKLVKDEILLDIGYGLYARAERSTLSGKLIAAKPLPSLAREAVAKLGIETVPTEAEIANYEGRSTQVPTGRCIGVKSRISRKIGYDGKSVSFELYA